MAIQRHWIKQWTPLGAVPPGDLHDARLQLLYAAQVPRGVAMTFLERRLDELHTVMGWRASHRALVGPRVSPGGFAVGLRPENLNLLLLDADSNSITQRHPLHRRTMEDAVKWMEDTLKQYLDRHDLEGLERPGADLPPHGLTAGERFSATPSAPFEELARWYENANRALEMVKRAHDGATDVRCPPRDLTLATRIILDRAASIEEARRIEVGISPGDHSCDQPYWYVMVWPHPGVESMAEAPGKGKWHTENWFGAVLTGETILAETSGGASPGVSQDASPGVSQGEAQAVMVVDFLDAALEACQGVAGAAR